MALDFPNSPTDGQVYTDTGTGEQWVYEAATNSWTSKGLVNTSGGLIYKGSIDITAAPPAGASSGWQYSVLADGTANAGFGPGITGTVAKGDIIMYTGTGWISTSHNVPAATAAVAGIDKKLWKKTGTVLEPETAADTVQISAGTAALPGLTPVGDPNTGIWSPGADQLAISTNGTERARIDSSGKLLVGTSSALGSEYLNVGGRYIIQTATKQLGPGGGSNNTLTLSLPSVSFIAGHLYVSSSPTVGNKGTVSIYKVFIQTISGQSGISTLALEQTVDSSSPAGITVSLSNRVITVTNTELGYNNECRMVFHGMATN